MTYRIAVMGLGKIARDQHLPVISKDDNFELVAAVSSGGSYNGVPTFSGLQGLVASGISVDAISLCMPPKPRFEIAREALSAGYHLLLERPPTSTVGELETLLAYAAERERVVFTAWHSRHNAAVDEAKRRLDGASVRRMRISWKEDVRYWHPGQEWIWEPGGFGVFDPGINALSLITAIMPEPVFVSDAEIAIPSNKATPIAASIRFQSASGGDADMTAEFDWLKSGEPSWDIDLETRDGMHLQLSNGGSQLRVDDKTIDTESFGEYEDIYRHFASLLSSGKSDVDASPLQLVSDCFILGRRMNTDAFV